MLYEEAMERLRYLFHKTRLTSDLYVPSEIVSAILYPCEKKPTINVREFVKTLEQKERPQGN